MYIIIAGTGEIVEYLSEVLSNESQDIIVVSNDADGLKSIDKLYNVLTVEGDPRVAETYASLRMSDCKMFIAMMRADADNIIACTLAKQLGARTTVARTYVHAFSADPNLRHFRSIGVDSLMNLEDLAANEIEQFLIHPWAKSWAEFFDGRLIVVAVKMYAGAPMVGKTLGESMSATRKFHVALIQRGETTIIPHGDDRVEAGDVLFMAANKEDIDEVSHMGDASAEIRRVVIMGGSEIALRLCENDNGKRFSYKLIEKDEEKARTIHPCAGMCTVIYGDATKISVLDYAGRAEAFVALSKSDEVNMVSCVVAREMGITHQIAMIHDFQNLTFAERFGINSVVNRKFLAANMVFALLLNSATSASKAISLTDAEIVSIAAKEGSAITKACVRDLKLPHEITLAGLMREGRTETVDGSTQILPGDQLVVVTKAGYIPKLERLFN